MGAFENALHEEASKGEVIDLYGEALRKGRELERRVAVLQDSIRWALGEAGEFSTKPDGAGNYWWRSELRRRAEMVYDPSALHSVHDVRRDDEVLEAEVLPAEVAECDVRHVTNEGPEVCAEVEEDSADDDGDEPKGSGGGGAGGGLYKGW